MPGAEEDPFEPSKPLARLPFPPVTRSHILHCSYHHWHPLYRSVTPKARLIPLSAAFLDYLREDGIVLPDDDVEAPPTWTDKDSGVFSQDQPDEDDEALLDPSVNFPDVHLAVRQTIAELGGQVVPKLNWSAPKDATWIAATNSMDCRSASDVYLLLKSSDFITHDLEHAFDDCAEDPSPAPEIPYVLVLRKHVSITPSLEFRCFVRDRRLVAITQRDLNHYAFLVPMVPSLRARIASFFTTSLRDTFPDANFVFDVYVPPPHRRVWLVDINPWAPRTDPLLFSWLELLSPSCPPSPSSSSSSSSSSSLASSPEPSSSSASATARQDEEIDFRLVNPDDPEAHAFNSPQYSAHKLPRDVVDAAAAGPGPLREFADTWRELVDRAEKET
ncbi:MAG: hypothetical protein M1832_003082 [Thelocarpon impressellum]|nr:MAG: hypothetical protein M1832_003082 [Thelocarpon impressellum]